MTPLRRQMIEAMELRGYAPSTIEGYVHAVAQLAGHYHRPPDRLAESQVRAYLLYLKGEKQVARGTFSVALGGIRFFYHQLLGRGWESLYVAKPRHEKKLPLFFELERLESRVEEILPQLYCETHACGHQYKECDHAGLASKEPDSLLDHTVPSISASPAAQRP